MKITNNNTYGLIDSYRIKKAITSRYKINFCETHHYCTDNPKELNLSKVMEYGGNKYMLKIHRLSKSFNNKPFLVEL